MTSKLLRYSRIEVLSFRRLIYLSFDKLPEMLESVNIRFLSNLGRGTSLRYGANFNGKIIFHD